MLKTQLILLVVILFLHVNSWPTPPPTIICSTFCATNGCTAWTMADCSSCYSGWTYSTNLGTCDFANTTNNVVMDYSDDAGGDISMSSDPGTGCTFSSSTYYYGNYKASNSITASLSIGTYTVHYAFDVYLDLLLVDTTGSDKWDNSVTMDATLLNSNSSLDQKLSQSIKVNGGGSSGVNAIGSTNSACGTNANDNYYRIVYKSYTHNATGTPINVTFQINGNSDNNAIWNMREVIFVAYTCNQYCLSCYNKSISQCYSCDASQGYMLSNTTCSTSCLSGYGLTADPSLCVLCSTYCTTCYGVADNCTVCKTTPSSVKSYLYYNTTLFYSQCLTNCAAYSPGYFANTTSQTCDLCDPSCYSCLTNATHCTSCTTGYGFYNYVCYRPCNTGFYYTNGTSNCTACAAVCSICTTATNCSVCTTTGNSTAYLLNNTCYPTCITGYYGTSIAGANVCVKCTSPCTSCTGTPTPCSACANGTYLYAAACSSTCPTGYVPYSVTNQCLNCDQYCVDLSINMWFPSTTNNMLYIDMTYTYDLNFTSFNYQTFQTVAITNNDINNFNITTQITGTNSYRIIVQPKGFIFLYNETVTVTTQQTPNQIDQSSTKMPFKTTNYLKTASISWFLLNSPNLSQLQQSIIDGLGSVNDVYANATTTPFLAQIKKSGFLSIFFPGAQITSTMIFVNSVPPSNLYQGSRFFGLSTYFDVPPWQRTSSLPNNCFGQQLHGLTQNQRRLFDLESLPWRYQRTGMTSFFIYDVYIPVLLIVTVWILGLVGWFLKKNCKCFNGYEMRYFTVVHKIHELTTLYVTTAMVLEWLYFDAASLQRWISLLICVLFTVYFVGYHLYIYYDMIRYPQAMIGNEKYEQYVTRYSYFLKNLRYQQYDMKEPWSWRHWFRPYNYHLLSYYKKFCMIITLPIFYDNPKWAVSVLIILQSLQIIRFLLTKPFHAFWRNVYRLCLQVFLLILFVVVFANTFMLDNITLNPSDVLDYVNIYYRLGWVGFAMIWLFNLGFIVLMFIDLVQGFRKSNREMMDQARRIFYYDKIVDYQKQNEQVPLGLMNRWVKLGNLNDRKHQELPDINVRIQLYRLVKHKEYYDVDVVKAVELFMNTDFNYHKENNTSPGKMIKKKIKLSKEVSFQLYKIVNQLYIDYAKKDTEAIIIKTLMLVRQKQFKAGDRVPLLPDAMFQKIELQSHTGDKQQIVLKEKLKGFPINPHELSSI